MAKFGIPTDERLAKINKLAKRTLSADELFVYPHKMAGDMIIPERHVQLTIPLLDQFVQNANAGVAFLLNHSWTCASPKPALPYGRIFEGELSKDCLVKGETTSFNGTAYLVRGQEKDGISTDSIISDIETGVLFDTSIGWGANKFECSICGNDIRDWRKCEHIPGKMYIIDDDTGESKLCWAMAKPPGYLMEDSAVFDGAYPGAGTSLSSFDTDGFENENGVFSLFDDFKTIPVDSQVYGTYSSRGGILTIVKKSDYKKIYSTGFEKESKALKFEKGVEKLHMNEKLLSMLETLGITYKEGETTVEEVLNKIADKLEILSVEGQEGEASESLSIPISEIKEALGKECDSKKLLELAKDGQDFADQKTEYDLYRKETVDSALAMGVRAMGNDFPSDTWKKTIEAMGKKAIEDITSTWEAQAKAGIPASRQTDPETGLEDFSNHESIPDEAFTVG